MKKKSYPQFDKELKSQLSFYKSMNIVKEGEKTLKEMNDLNSTIINEKDGGKIAQHLSKQMVLLGNLVVSDRKQQLVEN